MHYILINKFSTLYKTSLYFSFICLTKCIFYKILSMDKYIFLDRHIGVSEDEEKNMLQSVNVNSLKELIDQTVQNIFI